MASRKRRVITLEQKLKIIDDLKEGKSQLPSWKKLIPSSDADDNSSDAEEVASSDAFMDLFQELGYSTDTESWQNPQDWLAEDSTDPGYQLMTDSEIVAEVTGEKDSLDLESDEMEPQPTVSPSQAFHCCPEKSADHETNHSFFLFSPP